jgi:C4-dicarboxylate-binding protein DctP
VARSALVASGGPMQGRFLYVVLISLLISPQSADAQQVKLKAALHYSIKHPLIGAPLARLKEEVERSSDNSISIEIFDKGQLATDLEMADAVSSGKADMGITASQIFVGKAPALAILDLPFLFNFQALVEATAKPESEIRKLIDEALVAEAGMRSLLWQSLGDTHFYSKGRDVADVAQLKDQRVAVPGKALEEFVERCGGRPTTLATNDFHDAIRDGKVDMALMTLGGNEVLRLWKVQDTVTLTAHAPVEFLLVVNEKRWQSLSQEQRIIMTQAARIVEREGRARVASIDKAAESFAIENGMKLVHLTPDQVAEWRACSAAMLADYMDRNGERARKLMAAYGRLRMDACCSTMPGDDRFTRR